MRKILGGTAKIWAPSSFEEIPLFSSRAWIECRRPDLTRYHFPHCNVSKMIEIQKSSNEYEGTLSGHVAEEMMIALAWLKIIEFQEGSKYNHLFDPYYQYTLNILEGWHQNDREGAHIK
mmetsp:Transcript_34860/g.74311  ORF Transcript_34860/g.74311 Transcript_34860/m.74311 type:complete len:119 (-) Transcript_34860:26-382(-)